MTAFVVKIKVSLFHCRCLNTILHISLTGLINVLDTTFTVTALNSLQHSASYDGVPVHVGYI